MRDSAFREDDLEFTFAARAWSETVDSGDFDSYRRRFEVTQRFFEERGRLSEAVNVGNRMIRTILLRTKELEEAEGRKKAEGEGGGGGLGDRGKGEEMK